MGAEKPHYVYGMKRKMEISIQTLPDGFEEVHFYDEPDKSFGTVIYGEVVLTRFLNTAERKKYGLVLIGAERRA